MPINSVLRAAARRIKYFGIRRKCSVCNGNLRRFLEFGVDPRPEALCPLCGSLERHRLVIIFFRQKTDLFDGKTKKFLHVAPERAFVPLFRKAAAEGYLTADLAANGVMERMDITDIRHPDCSFDVIYCSHVLEHVLDDRKAMREFHRVLKPEGWAVLNVPINADRTCEDPSVTDPYERETLFEQHDHVRRYGPDYTDRLAGAGFLVTQFAFHVQHDFGPAWASVRTIVVVTLH